MKFFPRPSPGGKSDELCLEGRGWLGLVYEGQAGTYSYFMKRKIFFRGPGHDKMEHPRDFNRPEKS
jgi:hypothetical protein